MTPEQLQYVKSELDRGVDVETLKETLRQSGYGEELIAQLMNAAKGGDAQPVTLQPPQINQPTAELTTNQAEESQKSSSTFKIIAIIIGVLVVAVVGLVMVVSASLNNARESGMDAAAQQSLGNARSQAELYFNQNSETYTGFCQSPMAQRLFDTPVGMADCADSDTQYRMSVQLNSGEYWCIEGDAEASFSELFTGKVTTRPSGFSCQ